MGSLPPATEEKRPNFLVIVADDLGFSDCSCFGSEISTPNIDQLSRDGLRFTSFHVAAACSPTRAMLMTGTDHHLTGLGQLSEFVRVSPSHQGQPGHEGYLLESVAPLPELLRDNGYHTIMSGKWHLGLKKEYGPAARGFDKSFALLPGCANHYGYEPRYQDPVTEPPEFFETAVTGLHAENGECVRDLPNDFYSSDFYADKMVNYLRTRTAEEKAKPFFAYLPFSAPHWPLQAPKANTDKYKGQYSAGPSALRLSRLQRLRELGIISPDTQAHEVVTVGKEQKDWPELSEDEQQKSARAMEVYAGMVDRMDECVGRVIQYLKETGDYDNTFIMFMSDNGAEGASYEAVPLLGDQVVSHIEKYYDNSLDNIGRKDSFVWYGPRWAQAATAPGRLYKMHSTEGGCRVPLVVKPATQSLQPAGKITEAFCTVMDVVPTILEMAGATHPGTEYKGRRVEKPRGKSWVKYLQGVQKINDLGAMAIHDEDQETGFEIAGSGALRKGRYKITYVPKPRGPQRWELFDIIADQGETNDLSEKEPEIMEMMLKAWEKYKKEVGVVGLGGEIEIVPPVDEFEDTGKWIRFIGKDRSTIPKEVVDKVPVYA